eukprot:COSAG02_NODE_246_length_27291_cov_105.654200_3_plen_350_part_00
MRVRAPPVAQRYLGTSSAKERRPSVLACWRGEMVEEAAVVVGRARRERIAARKAARKAAKLSGGGVAGSQRQRAAEKKKARKSKKAKKQRNATLPEQHSLPPQQQAEEPQEQQQEQDRRQQHSERKAQRRSRKRSREESTASLANAPTSSAAAAAAAAAPLPHSEDSAGAAPMCTTLFYDGCDDEISAATAAALAESGVINDETLVWSEHPAFDFQGYTAWEECSYVFGVGDPPGAETAEVPVQLDGTDAPSQKKVKTESPDPPASQAQTATKYPYPVDDADHCETPAEAYADAAPVLHSLARQLGKTAAELKIWDPYFVRPFTVVLNRSQRQRTDRVLVRDVGSAKAV